MNKWNVWHYDGSKTNINDAQTFLGTVTARDEKGAIAIADHRYGLKTGRYQAYPHIDNIEELSR